MRDITVPIANLSPVTTLSLLLMSAYLENAVDDPQAKAAPNAYSAASIVPDPVLKFTAPFLKVTKKQALS